MMNKDVYNTYSVRYNLNYIWSCVWFIEFTAGL